MIGKYLNFDNVKRKKMANMNFFPFFLKKGQDYSNKWNNIFERTLKSLQPSGDTKICYNLMGEYSFK